MDYITWVGALATLGVYTFLYKDNPIFKFIQFLYAGMVVGYDFGYNWNNFVLPTFKQMGQGQWYLVFPIIIGLLIYFRYVPGLEWIARYPMSFFIGYGAGAGLAYSPPVLLGQIAKSFVKLYGASTLQAGLGNWVLLIAVLTSLAYFFFTVGQDNAVMKPVTTVGRYFIMAGLGGQFGTVVVYRYDLMIGRLNFLLFNWLKLPKPK